MIISRYIRNISAGILATILALGTGSCADDAFDGIKGNPGQIVLHVGAHGTRADNNVPTVPSEEEERNITELRYFLFPRYDTTGEFKTGLLTTPTPEQIANGQEYTLEDVKVGHYNIYVVANVPESATCKTEEELKQVMIDHTAKLNENYKKDGRLNLPMIAEVGQFTLAPEGASEVSAELKFACVKVGYRLLFYADGDTRRDGSTTATRPFGRNGFFVNKVTASGMTSEAPIVLTGADLTNFESSVNPKDFGTPAYSSNWTDNGKNVANKNDIDPGAAAEVTFGGKYIASGVMYLPERYVDETNETDGVTLKFHGWQTAPDATYSAGGAQPDNKGEHEYQLRIGHAEGGMWQLARGTYYEIIAEVVDPQSTQLEANVKISDWTVHKMAGDLSHTTLIVDKTKANITSLDTDSIIYATNAAGVTLGVPDDYRIEINGKSVSLVTTVTKPGQGEHTIHFRVNPEIPFESFGDAAARIPRSGTVPVWIQAGNIRKYIDVTYDVSPLFEVSPEGAVIQWKTKGAGVSDEDYLEYRTRIFEYRTNLGGLTLEGVTSGRRYNIVNGNLTEDANGRLQISIEKESDSHGYIKVIAMASPGDETITYELNARPATSGYNYLGKTLTVDLKPTYDTYRIYFRAINDNQNDANLADYSGNNVAYFYDSSWGTTVKYYVYTQMGQTVGDAIPDDWVWRFTNGYPGNDAVKSNGWTRLNISATEKGICTAGEDGTYKNPKGGETLIIFNNGASDTRHRMAFHLDPGIQLFDYEDMEGYYIFDPLCNPYYKVFDSRPEIENVQYRIFSKSKVAEIYITYAGKEENTYTLKLTGKAHGKMLMNTEGTSDGETWYMNEFYAQCPEGNYAKSLKVKFEDNTVTTLFDGQNYYNASNKGISRGIYEDGKWRMGAIQMEGVESTTRSIYLHDMNGSKWSTAHLYAWKGNEKNANWPGVAMTSLGNNWWKIDISKTFTQMIFNPGGDTGKSGDLSIPNSDNIYYERNSSGGFSITSARP